MIADVVDPRSSEQLCVTSGSELLREQFETDGFAAERVHDEDGVRLALCCLALLDWYRVG